MSLDPHHRFGPAGGASSQVNSAVHSRRKSATPLPHFNFSPGEAKTEPADSPPISPTGGISIRPRSGGHRRGGSEFIGGDGKSGGLGLMSSSPTKGEGALPLPMPAGAPPRPGGRRGHAHKRSGAISCHDLSGVLRPANPSIKARAESAPSSPVDTAPVPGPFPEAISSPDPMPPRRQSIPQEEGRGARRARVGFSDSVEFIPRPLSTISSDTSSSQTTVRGGNTMVESISSLKTTAPEDRSVSISPDRSSKASCRQRPSTAGAVMTKGDRSEMVRPSSSPERPNPVPSRTWPFFPRADPAEAAPPLNHGVQMLKATSSSDRRSSWKVEKSGKKVKGWAGSILSSKLHPKVQKQGQDAQPCPALQQPEHESPNTPSPAIEFDPENTCTIVSEPIAFVLPPPIATQPPGSPRRTARPADSDCMSPVIDLDAALGPFNTPSLGSPSGGILKGVQGGTRRRARGGITAGRSGGPQQDYHRRTESAPELAGLEHRRSSLQRLRSRATMADVFEEDEEDELASREAVQSKTQTGSELGIGISVVESSNPEDGAAMDWGTDKPRPEQPAPLTEKGAESEYPEVKAVDLVVKADRTHETRPPVKSSSPGSNRSADDVKIVDLDDHVQGLALSGALSDDMPAAADDMTKNYLVDDPHMVTIPPMQHDHLSPVTPSMTMSSSASPELHPVIFDPPGAFSPSPLTSASSFTDERTIHSLLTGEPGPEMRMSVDEAPSLTSDNSTMRSVNHRYGGPSSTDLSVRGVAGRSGSFTSDAAGVVSQDTPRPVAAKRSSLVSLSKLVGGSHNEKSKLSIETRAQPESSDGSTKEKKRKRFRLMQLFRSKLAN